MGVLIINIACNTYQLLLIITMTTEIYNEHIVFARSCLSINSFILKENKEEEEEEKP